MSTLRQILISAASTLLALTILAIVYAIAATAISAEAPTPPAPSPYTTPTLPLPATSVQVIPDQEAEQIAEQANAAAARGEINCRYASHNPVCLPGYQGSLTAEQAETKYRADDGASYIAPRRSDFDAARNECETSGGNWYHNSGTPRCVMPSGSVAG